uniref:Putative secreted peptide n=1 Tax=Anopheles braziliensis TaxID=58242 RepID=A0A2M3ZPC8_9DIPT
MGRNHSVASSSVVAVVAAAAAAAAGQRRWNSTSCCWLRLASMWPSHRSNHRRRSLDSVVAGPAAAAVALSPFDSRLFDFDSMLRRLVVDTASCFHR